jgi:hypothetical protein
MLSSILVMRTQNFSTESEWRTFEIESWRRAVRDRGLKLKFLDPEQQQPFFEALQLPLALRGYRAGHRLWNRIPLAARRIAAAAAIFGFGYLACDLAPAAKHFTHNVVAFTEAHPAADQYSASYP